MDILEAYKDRLGLQTDITLEKPHILQKETRHFITIKYYVQTDNELILFTGTSKNAFASIKDAFKIAKENISQKCPQFQPNSQFIIDCYEQQWAPIPSTNILLDDNFTMQPIESRKMKPDEFIALLK